MSYVLSDGTILPSVTEILEATQTKKQREQLELWQAANPGTSEAAQIRGTAVHTAAAAYLLQPQPRLPLPPGLVPFGQIKEREERRTLWENHIVSLPEAVRGFYRSILPFLAEIGECYWVEHQVGGTHQFVWSKLGYAGRPDIVAIIDGRLTLIDLKTSNQPYCASWKNKAGYAKYCKAATQLAAYNLALQETLQLQPTRFMILVALENSYQELEISHNAWVLAKKRWHKKLKTFQRIWGCI